MRFRTTLGALATTFVLGALVLGLGTVVRLAAPDKSEETSAAGLAASTTGGTVYVANETSGTVSVIDVASNTLVDTICLGSDPAIPLTPQPNGPCNAEPDHHRPLYNGQIGPHGLWLTPDGLVLLVTNRLSGTIVAVDTTTRKMLGYIPVEREPHLTTIRPAGNSNNDEGAQSNRDNQNRDDQNNRQARFEAWVAIRGESQIDVLDLNPRLLFDPQRPRTERLARTDTLGTVLGPSMVSFTSNGRYAFVVSAKQRLVEKIDADTRQVVASQKVSVPFSPFGLVSPDDQELFVVHKLAGTVSILRTSDLSFVVQDLPVGPCANHVWFVGRLAYVTVGGVPPCAPGGVDRQGKVVIIDRLTHSVVRELSGATFTGDPHGIWGTPDGRRLFVGHERGNRVTVIDTGNPNDPADDKVVATIPVGKQPIDVVVGP